MLLLGMESILFSSIRSALIHLWPRFSRFNHVIQITALRRYERIREALPEFLCLRLRTAGSPPRLPTPADTRYLPPLRHPSTSDFGVDTRSSHQSADCFETNHAVTPRRTPCGDHGNFSERSPRHKRRATSRQCRMIPRTPARAR